MRFTVLVSGRPSKDKAAFVQAVAQALSAEVVSAVEPPAFKAPTKPAFKVPAKPAFKAPAKPAAPKKGPALKKPKAPKGQTPKQKVAADKKHAAAVAKVDKKHADAVAKAYAKHEAAAGKARKAHDAKHESAVAKARKAHDAKHAGGSPIEEAGGVERAVVDIDCPEQAERLQARSDLGDDIFVEAYVHADGDGYGDSSSPEIVHQPGHTSQDERVAWVVGAVQARA